MLMPKDIANDVRAVLLNARTGTGTQHHYLTAFQILARLPDDLRAQIIAERGFPGQGTGKHYNSASLVSDSAESIGGIEKTYMDTGGLEFYVDGKPIVAGYGVCGLYRLS
jgi:hypothetical protein